MIQELKQALKDYEEAIEYAKNLIDREDSEELEK